MSGRHMNARPKRLTRKQKEALSAHGWDSRQYLFIQDSPDDGGWVLMNKTTGHYEVFTRMRRQALYPVLSSGSEGTVLMYQR